ncbi:MAG: exo-beta-N-acetylmuramidase NamZ domain-containing protein [Acidobacteriota bacterium]
MKRALAAFLLVAGCRTGTPPSLPASAFAHVDAVIETATVGHRIPGGVLVVQHGQRVYTHVYGNRALIPVIEPITANTIYDLASLTKVVATTPSVMILIEEGKVQLDAPAKQYLPEFSGDGRDAITVRMLMTHTSGLRPDVTLTDEWSGRDEGIRRALTERARSIPGTHFLYSDINFILLGQIVERVSGELLEQFAAQRIFSPLRMVDTSFVPPADLVPRIAPTEPAEGRMLRGVVHDPTSRRMGGVAGHAGLFSTVTDLSRYARMILNGGTLDGVRILKPETVRLMTSIASPPGVGDLRALGWDVDTYFSRPRGGFPLGSFGHTGYTGPMIWIDPQSDSFYIFLTNRVHPDGKGSVVELQKELGRAVTQALGIPPSLALPIEGSPRDGAPAFNGIDVLEAQHFTSLRGMNVGLITNPTGRDRSGRSSIDLLRDAPGVSFKALFSPEHGIRADVDEAVGDSTDSGTGLPIYSLYGQRRKPSPEQLQGLDALIFDIQDVGARFYTYIATMGLAMEAAADAHIPFIVLDRINPIDGMDVEGPSTVNKTSFTAFHPIAVRHGMTAGELAQMFREEKKIDVDLRVVAVRNWKREQWQDQTGLPWVNTSPNIRNLTEATLYPGVALLESSEVSVGRGTPHPFEWMGAPYIEGPRLATELNASFPKCVRFAPIDFTPDSSKFAHMALHGVSMALVDREHCPVVDLGIVIGETLWRWYPDQFHVSTMNNLLRHPATIVRMQKEEPLDEIKAGWVDEMKDFLARREKYLIYR